MVFALLLNQENTLPSAFELQSLKKKTQIFEGVLLQQGIKKQITEAFSTLVELNLFQKPLPLLGLIAFAQTGSFSS